MGIDPLIFEDGVSQETQKVDLSRYWKALKRRWWVVVITSVVVTVPWVIYVKQELPVYEATAVIRFKSYSGDSELLMNSRYQEITSRSFNERVVAELGLVLSIKQQDNQDAQIFRKQIFAKLSTDRNPVSGLYVLRFPDNGRFILYQAATEEQGEIELRKGNVLDATVDTVTVNGFSFQLANNPNRFPSEVVFEVGNFRSVVRSLQERIQVAMAQDGTRMEVSLSDNDPYVVTQTVNSLATLVVQESIKGRRMSYSEQRKILEGRLELAKRELDASELKLKLVNQRATVGSSDISLQDKLSRRAAVDRELSGLMGFRDTLKDLFAQLDGLQQSSANGTNGQNLETRRLIFRAIVSHQAFDANAAMILNRQRLEELERQRNEIVRLTGEDNFRAVELLRDIDRLHTQIEDLARSRLATLGREITQKQLELAQLEATLKQLPNEKAELSEVQREYEQKSRLYQDLYAQHQKALIDETVESETIDILDPAIEPEFPINHNKKAKAAAGGVFGVFLGIFFVFAWELLDRSLKTADDIKTHLKLNVLGTIPHVDFENVFDFQDHEKAKMIDQQLVTHDFSPTPIGEAYRSLRTSIIFSKKTGRIQTLLITSTSPGDGKSFTAANLSITLAQQKSKTLLVDTDLRRGVQHNTFGVSKEPGFSNFLAGTVLSAEIINETHIPNLSMISCGSLVPNPSELLGSLQMRRFLDEMRRKFDVIIFDTPPLNAATDAVVLGTQVDGVTVVVRAGKTNRDIARQKLELFHNLEAKIIGVILNGTTVDLAHEGYSYYHY
jgi:tyrosine-protein kinase Etk/Wzc